MKLTYFSLTSLAMNLLHFAICDVSLSDDPSLWPGHLQPLGAGRPKMKVEEVDGFPQPEDFFKNYVHSKPKKAVIFKGGAKLSPAFTLWTDEYLKNHPESETMQFDVEVGKKETRQGNMERRNVKEFVESYRHDDVYAVTDVPQNLQNLFLLPPVLRCNSIKGQLSMMLMWFSSGGTKSVLHQDSFENINCLFRGQKRLLIAEYPKYKKQVVIDRPNGYTAVDVDKVDFVKYPGLREVEYFEANMEEGDCLYIPYQWFHQVTSYANENKTNMALNVWWYKNDSYAPRDCKMSPEEATLDKFEFKDQNQNEYGSDDQEGESDNIEGRYGLLFQDYFKIKNAEEIPFDTFLADIQDSNGPLAELGVHEIENKPRKKKFASLFYKALDVDNNGELNFKDYNYEFGESEDDEGENYSPERMAKLHEFSKVSRLLERYFNWLEKKKEKVKSQEDTENNIVDQDQEKSSGQPIKEEL